MSLEYSYLEISNKDYVYRFFFPSLMKTREREGFVRDEKMIND